MNGEVTRRERAWQSSSGFVMKTINYDLFKEEIREGSNALVEEPQQKGDIKEGKCL